MQSGISVIIPVYNAEKYISRCLDSVTCQIYTDLEILCVIDKNSSDNSEEIIKDYARKDNRIRILHGKDKCGSGYNRNVGIQHATKEYIGFTDADDYIDSDFYLRLYDFAKIYNSDITMGETKVLDTETQEVEHDLTYMFLVEYSLEKKLKVLHWSTVWDKIYRTEFIKKENILFPEEVVHEDNLFILKTMEKSNKLVIVPGSYYYWARNDSSITKSKDTENKRFIDAYKVFNEILDYVSTLDVSKEVKSQIIEFNINTYASKVLFSNEYAEELSKKIHEIISQN